MEEKKEAKEEVLKNQEEWDQEEVVGRVGKVARVVEKEGTISVPWIQWVILGVHLVDHSLVKTIVEMEPF